VPEVDLREAEDEVERDERECRGETDQTDDFPTFMFDRGVDGAETRISA
jgi:hypothetical protein